MEDMITSEETMEIVEGAKKSTGKTGILIAAGLGVLTLGGALAYKYGIKPLLAKRKARKEEDESADNEVEDEQESD